MTRMFSMMPFGVVNEGNGWGCALAATAIIAVIIFLFACGGSARRRGQ